jgi:hypothetical protein
MAICKTLSVLREQDLKVDLDTMLLKKSNTPNDHQTKKKKDFQNRLPYENCEVSIKRVWNEKSKNANKIDKSSLM